jgi:methylamine dehydrogenase accessory protein MauD
LTALYVSNALLWLLLIALSVAVLALVRQLGILHERLSPVASLAVGARPTLGERAPAVQVTDLDGAQLSIGSARADGKSTLLLFVSPTCPVCKTLLPELGPAHARYAAALETFLVGEGDPDEQRAFRAQQGLLGLPYISSAPLGVAYQVSRLPFVALIDGAGVLRAYGQVDSAQSFAALLAALPAGVAGLQANWQRRHRPASI